MLLSEKDIIIDVETRCDLSLKDVGVYKYCRHHSFKVLLISVTFGNLPNSYDNVITIDLTQQDVPDWFTSMLYSSEYRKHAHNAIFEILSFESLYGRPFTDEEISQWYCSMACVAFCGLPLKLEDSANALNHSWKKLETGNDLIKLFCVPKEDGTYSSPTEHTYKWAKFIEYNKADVLAEKANLECLPELPEIFNEGKERTMWLLDHKINYKGVAIDVELAKTCDQMCEREDLEMLESIRGIAIKNINSRDQVLAFLRDAGIECTTLRAEDYDKYLDQAAADSIVRKVLEVKKNYSLSSASKFSKFVDTCLNGRIYGTLQYYAANRTGRWGGRGAQPQNLKRNEMDFAYLCLLRDLAVDGNYEAIQTYFGSVKENIVELCRTIVVPEDGNQFLASDFSAIEARVTAWIANEEWRLNVFRTHGKIYEASAAMMFKVPFESIKKGSMERMKGKYAELALGFAGWVGAFLRFGADKFMTKKEMTETAIKWRDASPNIVKMWDDVETCAINAVKNFGSEYVTRFGVVYKCVSVDERRWLTVKLLSGRRLMYFDPQLAVGQKGSIVVKYRRNAKEQDTWRGSLVENLVQAIARDLIVEKIIRMYELYDLLPVLHVHDEIVYDLPSYEALQWKEILNHVMSEEIDWAKGLPLKGDTDILKFYMKAA